MDGFSAHFEPYGSIFSNFHDFDSFAAVSSRLTLFPQGPGALRDRPEDIQAANEAVNITALQVEQQPQRLWILVIIISFPIWLNMPLLFRVYHIMKQR